MKYTVFVTSPVKIEINAANEEEAKKIYGHNFRASYNWIEDVLMDEDYIS